jgi:uncharacterized membrane protein YbhN (UPF0104 family)
VNAVVGSGAPRLRRVAGLAKAAVALAVLASVVVALRGYGHALEGRLGHVHPGWLAVALIASIVYRVANAFGWVLVLRSLGQPIRAWQGVRLWLVSETLRWLPGSVWSFFSRVAQAKLAGVPAATASLSLPLELLLTIAAWGLAAVGGLGFSGAAGVVLARLPGVWVALFVVGLAVSIGSALAIGRFLPATRLARKLRGLGEGLEALREARPRPSLLAGTLVLFTALCLLNGAAFFAVLRSVCDAPPPLLAAVGINAAGWLMGFFAFFAPAGLGVREGGMAGMLAPLMPIDAAVVGVLLWRLLQVLVELLCLAACLRRGAVASAQPVATTSVET